MSDLQRSIGFYHDIVGLQLARYVFKRIAAFFRIGNDSRCSMLGLWSLGKTPVGFTLHVAFEVAKMDYLLKTPKWLKALGITPLSFYSIESEEPSVIGWMPAASIYFRDLDGHLIEYLTMLKEKEPKHDIRVIGWFEWLSIGRDRLQQDQHNNN